jgi:hypothetical protein
MIQNFNFAEEEGFRYQESDDVPKKIVQRETEEEVSGYAPISTSESCGDPSQRNASCLCFRVV